MGKHNKLRLMSFMLLCGAALFFSMNPSTLASNSCPLDLPPQCPNSDITLQIDVNEYTENDEVNSCDLTAPGFFRSFISGAQSPFDILNGENTGWCIDLEAGITENITYRVDFWSSVDPDLPGDLAAIPWDQINWLLNYKTFQSAH
jgi:hypothetical protein